jgi:hypothetical protein
MTESTAQNNSQLVTFRVEDNPIHQLSDLAIKVSLPCSLRGSDSHPRKVQVAPLTFVLARSLINSLGKHFHITTTGSMLGVPSGVLHHEALSA